MDWVTIVIAVLGSSVLVALINNAFNTWKVKHDDNDATLRLESKLDAFIDSSNESRQRLKRDIDDLGVQNKIQMSAIGNLLGHTLDGNHTEQLRKNQRQLEEYLIERMN